MASSTHKQLTPSSGIAVSWPIWWNPMPVVFREPICWNSSTLEFHAKVAAEATTPPGRSTRCVRIQEHARHHDNATYYKTTNCWNHVGQCAQTNRKARCLLYRRMVTRTRPNAPSMTTSYIFVLCNGMRHLDVWYLTCNPPTDHCAFINLVRMTVHADADERIFISML